MVAQSFQTGLYSTVGDVAPATSIFYVQSVSNTCTFSPVTSSLASNFLRTSLSLVLVRTVY